MSGLPKILIVDDRAENLLALEASLRRDALVILNARSGAEALETLLAHDVALAIIDVQMPDLDGFELADLMRGSERTAHIPVIFLTAGANDQERIYRGYDSGAVDFIFKPYDPLILTSKVGVFVQLYENRQELAEALRQQKKTEEELRQANATIVEDAERMKKIEAQLLESQKMEAIGRLAAGIAHDFNNLMTVVLGNVELLDEMAPEHPLHENAFDIREAAQRAATLTRQLLAFGRKQILFPRVFKLNAIVSNLSSMLARLVGEHVRLDLILAQENGSMRADPSQIEQVMMNLVVNARDAMPGGGTISVRTAAVDLDDAFLADHPAARVGPHVVLTVADTGHGMSAATRARIFEPFFTTKAFGQSSGLGLSMVEGIVSQSGGWIEVDSTEGRGTTFRIYFPRTTEPVDAEAKRIEAPKTDGGTETILVVEDEAGVLQLISSALTQLGYDVLAAQRPDEALRLAREHPRPVTLLVTDVMMPEMNGPELAERLQALRPGLKVLFISGYPDVESSAPLGEPARGRWFMSKPFTGGSVGSKVREILETHREDPRGGVRRR